MATADSNGEPACLQCSFKICMVVSDVTLTQAKLSWVKKGDTANKSVHVPVDEILSVKKLNGRKGEGFEVIGFAVCYIKHQKKYLLKQETVQFLGSSVDCEQWSKKIQEALDQAPRRPRKLLVIVNPISGSGNGMKIYQNTAAGIFKLANVQTDVKVTERPHHCEEILTDYDLKSIDGIVLVGGDGSYHQTVNALQRRLLKKAGLDENDSTTDLLCAPFPIGIIPAGTGNGIAVGCYGCEDAQTATLAIIAGKRLQNNVLAVHCDQELVGYASLLIGFGVWGDLMYNADKSRRWKKLRYLFAILGLALERSFRQMDLDISYLPPLNTEEDQGESHSISEPVAAKEHSTTEPASQSCIIKNDKEVTDLVVDASNIEIQVKSSTTNTKTKDKEPTEERNIPIIDEKQLEESSIQSSIINSSAGAANDKNLEMTRKSAKTVDFLLNDKDKQRNIFLETKDEEPTEERNISIIDEKQLEESTSSEMKTILQNRASCEPLQNSQVEVTKWKNIQGSYIGVSTFLGDYWNHSETMAESYTRMFLNKQCSGVQLISIITKMVMQKTDLLENSFTDHMPAKEMTVKFLHPSDPTSENGIKENRIELDGEIYPLKQPQFTIKFHPKVLQLYAQPTDHWLWKNNKIED